MGMDEDEEDEGMDIGVNGFGGDEGVGNEGMRSKTKTKTRHKTAGKAEKR